MAAISSSTSAPAALSSSTSATAALVTFAIQFVFLFTGVFSTCAAQFVFYQGAGDQKAMLLPLCNYLGMMLVGLIPASYYSRDNAQIRNDAPTIVVNGGGGGGGDALGLAPGEEEPEALPLRHADLDADARDDPECTGPVVVQMLPMTTASSHQSPSASSALVTDTMELTRRPTHHEPLFDAHDTESLSSTISSLDDLTESPTFTKPTTAAATSTISFSTSALQLCIGISVVLDFAGCIFSNIGLAMAGSGLYQVVYSSVICWSALLSRFVLKKVVSKDEWIGIALVTFGLAFSALGESTGGRNNYVVLMGCFNSLIGAAFYGGNYVTGEYMLKLPERPQPKELCLKIGTACVGIIAIYQLFFVLPVWHDLVTKPIDEAGGNSTHILIALVTYTLSQLAHGLTYFMMLGSSGAVTTGIMQSLRAVCVFIISSLIYCSVQESQCFDTKRGIATLIVVSGVMFYSWAKSQAKTTTLPPPPPSRRKKSKLIAGKNFVV